MEKLKLLQVGVGGWGYSWAGVVQESKYWEAVGYVDIDQQNLVKTSEAYGLSQEKCFNDLDKALKIIECDAVLVVVPPKYHKEVAIKALEKGKHVLVEKPLADTFPSAFEMVNKAEEVDKRLMVSQNYRFKRASRTVKKVLKKEIVGQPGYITVNFHKATHFDSPFRLEMEEPLLRDMSIHHFDQMRYFVR
ncbi:MAG: Gfo/Idh/MocA family oxidoreductase [Halanaerobiales bacterium]|nr:Gfo/Idh/MocA family oxidoreductase [Halanaerobiales bacterium]